MLPARLAGGGRQRRRRGPGHLLEVGGLRLDRRRRAALQRRERAGVERLAGAAAAAGAAAGAREQPGDLAGRDGGAQVQLLELLGLCVDDGGAPAGHVHGAHLPRVPAPVVRPQHQQPLPLQPGPKVGEREQLLAAVLLLGVAGERALGLGVLVRVREGGLGPRRLVARGHVVAGARGVERHRVVRPHRRVVLLRRRRLGGRCWLVRRLVLRQVVGAAHAGGGEAVRAGGCVQLGALGGRRAVAVAAALAVGGDRLGGGLGVRDL